MSVDFATFTTGTAPPLPEGLRSTFRSKGFWNDESIGWLLERAADRWPNRVAVVDNDGPHTYADLRRKSDSLAAALLAAGIRSGQVVTWMLPNCLGGIAVPFAAWRVGAVSNPVVTIYREHELTFILDQLRPFAVVAPASLRGRALAEELEAIFDRIGHDPALRLVLGGDVSGWQRLEKFAAPPRPALRAARPVDAASPCQVLYTSGSTAEPKGVVHCSRSLLHEVRSMQREWSLSAVDRFFMASPLTHSTGSLQGTIVPVMLGATNVLQSVWDPELALRLIQNHAVTYSVGATVFLQGLVDEYQRIGVAPTLRQFTCGGASVPPTLIEDADELGIAAYRVWGMTEFPTTTLASADDSLEQRARTDGHRAEGVEVEAFDPDGNMLSASEVGELWVRGPERMLGYVRAELNEEVCKADGWFLTGDVGFVSPDGYVTVTGRIKDIINRGGEKFAARDIEDVLATHPSVAEASVMGVPGGRLGERVCAAVVLRQGAAVTADGLIEFLDDARLAKQKIPEEIRFYDALPRTAAGKVQKFKLVDEWGS